jgi:hypothetical protein
VIFWEDCPFVCEGFVCEGFVCEGFAGWPAFPVPPFAGEALFEFFFAGGWLNGDLINSFLCGLCLLRGEMLRGVRIKINSSPIAIPNHQYLVTSHDIDDYPSLRDAI